MANEKGKHSDKNWCFLEGSDVSFSFLPQAKKNYQITKGKCVVYVTFTRTNSAFGPIMHIAIPIKVAGDKPKIGGDYIFKTPNNSWTSSASCSVRFTPHF